MSGEGEPAPEIGRGGARPQRPDEAELAHLGVGWSCSRALDCSDESMLMTINSSSSGTLVLVPRKSKSVNSKKKSKHAVRCENKGKNAISPCDFDIEGIIG